MTYRKFGLATMLFIVLLAACAPVPPAREGDQAGQTPEQPASASSGIEGQVLLGPSCPVQQSDKPCEEQPFQARIVILDMQDSVLQTMNTAEDGTFKISMAPGTYTLRPMVIDETLERQTQEIGIPAAEKYPRAEEMTVTVEAGVFTQVVIQFDTGVR